jgi:hypothetical protein
MKNDITALRKRMAEGRPIDGDLNWLRRRKDVLAEWPEPLSREQELEMRQIETWLTEYAA